MQDNKPVIRLLLCFACTISIYHATSMNIATATTGGFNNDKRVSAEEEDWDGKPSNEGAQCGQKYDEYGNIKSNDTKARLDNFAIQLQNNANARGYMIFYGPRRGRAGTVQRRLNTEKGYLVQMRGIAASRLVTLIGGNKEEATTELWVVPISCAPPRPTPTVPPNQVVILQHPEVPAARLLIIQALVRELGPLANPVFRRHGDSPLDEWSVHISYLRERNDWAWVELDQSYEGEGESLTLEIWALLRKIGGRWRAVEKRSAETNIPNTHRDFVRAAMRNNPTAPREIFN